MSEDIQESILIGPSSFGEIEKNIFSKIENAGYKVIKNPVGRKLSKQELINLLNNNVVGLIAGLETIDQEVIQKSNLKAISRVGSGTSNIDTKILKKNKIRLDSVPDGPTQSVAEITIANIINLSRQIIQMDQNMKNKKWKRIYGNEIKNKKVFIIGLGNIGKRVAEFLKAIGSQIIIFDPYVNKENFPEFEFCNLNYGLQNADIISIHASGDNCILSKNEFKQLKKGVILCNSARGELVDEDELCLALDKGIVAGAWIDAYIDEPYSGKLVEFKQCILTPHVSSLTSECRVSMERLAVDNILKALNENKLQK